MSVGIEPPGSDRTEGAADVDVGSPQRVARIAGALFEARMRRAKLAALPDCAGSLSLAEAMAVQYEVGRRLARNVAGWKAGLVPGVRFTCAPVYASDVLRSPAVFRLSDGAAPGEVETAFVEGEIAFRLGEDLPVRARPYRESDVVAAIESCCAAIEVGDPRIAGFDAAPLSHKLADSMGNGAIVWGSGTPHWRDIDPAALRVVFEIDGVGAVERIGGGNGAPPLTTLVALANAAERRLPLRAGQTIITGNCTGLNRVASGATVRVVFDGLGEARVRID
ncbi:2-keto-4-pentenoate hydratase [Paraburkholderia sp.]|uniref:2-keto-4-pentenoate hydratase n=1 Tax=Paraburkholderia sp. TaxID=1926495 RepID=UPI0039E43C7F